MSRGFIQETIDTLSNASKEIDKFWKQFQKGEINKEKFEEEYHHILADWLDIIEHEEYYPNNGCKYSVTNPNCEYFKSSGV